MTAERYASSFGAAIDGTVQNEDADADADADADEDDKRIVRDEEVV